MGTYRKVVELVDGWQNMTDAELIEAATAKDLPWADPDKWTLLGIAGLIGPQNVSTFLSFLSDINYAWVGTQAAGAGVPIGDEQFNAAMRSINHPFCQAIADAGRKMVSLCDLQGLPNDGQRVIEAAKQMRVEKLQSDKLRVDADRWNKHVKAVQLWDGDPATEPNL